MEAHSPQQMAHEVVSVSQPTEGLANIVLDRIGQLVCGLHGHDQVLQFQESRMFLRCVSCGYESPGWQMPDRSPVLKFGPATRTTAEAEAPPARRVA